MVTKVSSTQVRRGSTKFHRNSIDQDGDRLLTGGCLMSVGSAAITGLLLFLNGSFVLAVISALAKAGFEAIADPSFSQFLLFTIPILMVIVQWYMIDYVRNRQYFKPHDSSETR
jgi:hypothetical protein